MGAFAAVVLNCSDADVTTIEACLSLSLLQQAKMQKAATDVIQQINDLLSEDAAPPTQPEAVSEVTRLTETFKFQELTSLPRLKLRMIAEALFGND